MFLITGATGKQGGSVARSLLQSQKSVRAFVRDPSKEASQQLQKDGAELFVGNLDDRDAVQKACRGCRGVFSVQNGWDRSVGFDGELRQATNLAEAAMAEGVNVFIQSTMAAAEDVRDVPHFHCKRQIEQMLAKCDLPLVLLGTVYFMENVLDPNTGGSMTFPTLSGSLDAATRLHLLSHHDIGNVVAKVVDQPQRFIGHRIDLTGDELTVAEMKTIYRRVSGKKPKWYSLPHWVLKRIASEFAIQMRWHNANRFDLDVSKVRQQFPTMTSFEDFLARERVTNL